MVQKEVGNRFKANPGSKEYGSLTVFLDYYFDIKKVMDVSKNVFLPKPNVDSIVISFTKKDQVLTAQNEEHFFQLVRDSFKQKRKTLRNNLKSYNLEVVERVLKKYDQDLSVRGENITLEEFIEMSNELCKEK